MFLMSVCRNAPPGYEADYILMYLDFYEVRLFHRELVALTLEK